MVVVVVVVDSRVGADDKGCKCWMVLAICLQNDEVEMPGFCCCIAI